MPSEPPKPKRSHNYKGDALVLRQTAEKTQVCIIQLHNLNVELKSLRSELRTLFLLFTKLLPPDDRADFAEMVRRDNLNQKAGILQKPQE